MVGILSPAALLAIMFSCSNNEIAAPTRNLDRPSDVAFACLYGTTDGGFTPLPIRCCSQVPDGGPFMVTTNQDLDQSGSCSYTSVDGGHFITVKPDAGFPTDAGVQPTLVAYVANSGRGEIAVVNVPLRTPIDTDRVREGYNFITVGSLPSDIAAKPDGTRVYTANAGSCDLTALDTRSTLGPPRTSQLIPQVTVAGQKIRPRPEQLVIDGNKDQAWVSFPTCRIISLLDLTTGQPIRSAYIDPLGQAHDISEAPACSANCAIPEGTTPVAFDGGMGLSSPHGLAVTEGAAGKRLLFVGNALSTYLTVVDADNLTHVASFDLKVATTRVRVSRPVAERSNMRYVYAVARDGTIEVLGLAPDGTLARCDTNRSPTAPLPPDAGLPGCPPIDPAAREALARNPAIALPSGALARDVTFGDVTAPPDAGVDTPHQLRGVFAYVTASNGNTYVVQIYDRNPNVTPTGGLIHELRNGTILDGGGPLVSPATRNLVTGNLSNDESLVAPYLAIPDGGPAGADAGVQLVTGGNPPPTEQWTATYEGVLKATVRTTGRLPSGDQIIDPAADFCAFDVRTGDKLEITGCSADTDCPQSTLPGEPIFVCHREPGTPVDVTGICLLQDTDATPCKDAASGRREFLIDKVAQSVLQLAPIAQDEITIGQPVGPTPLRICTNDSDCSGAAGTKCFAGICATACTETANCQDLCTNGAAGCAVCDPVGVCVQSCTGGQTCDTMAGFRCVAREPNRGIDNGGLECRLTCNADSDCSTESGYTCVGGLCRASCQATSECESRAPTRQVTETDPTGQQVQRSLSYVCAAGRCMLGCTGSGNQPDPTACNQGDRFRCLNLPEAGGGSSQPVCVVAKPFDDLTRSVCYPEFTGYQIRIGNSFLVTGTTTSVLTNQISVLNECTIDSTPDDPANPLRTSRAYIGQPFANPYFSFLIDSIEPPPRDFVITFAVSGGFSALFQATGVLPLGVTLGPDKWLYVVDQGDSVPGPLGVRGSLYRMDPSSTVLDPTFLIR
jgi:DNA-binding beta-propeller fold protein YncE